MTTSVVKTQLKLRNNIEELKPFLNVSEPFTADDVDGERAYEVLNMMNKNGAIQKVGTTFNGEHYVGEWEWVETEKEAFKEHLEERDEFPCGHRVAIYNDPETPEDTLGCRACAEQGKHPEFSKEQVKEWL